MLAVVAVAALGVLAFLLGRMTRGTQAGGGARERLRPQAGGCRGRQRRRRRSARNAGRPSIRGPGSARGAARSLTLECGRFARSRYSSAVGLAGSTGAPRAASVPRASDAATPTTQRTVMTANVIRTAVRRLG